MKVAITAREFSGANEEAISFLISNGLETADYSDVPMGAGTSEEDVIAAVGDSDFVIAGIEPYSAKVIENCPNLKIISRRGIGYENIDMEACRRRNIAVLRAVGSIEGSVGEAVMSYILYFSRRVDLQSSYLHQKEWRRIMTPGAKTRILGLVGFGGVGQEIAKRATAFDMNLVYYCRHPLNDWESKYKAVYMPLDQLLSVSDYVSVNLPLTDKTRNMFDRSLINKIKKGSYLINIARGQIVDEEAVRDALCSGRLAGAAVDVFNTEPCTDSSLMGLPNVILTPHTAPYTEENFASSNMLAARNLIDCIAGTVEQKYRII